MIKIYDTKTRTKREFVPVNEGKVGMYVCGPTVYNYIHIGNARTFISFDTIRRYLTWRGFEVTFVQNVTDVDDKIINKALEESRTAAEVAEEYTDAFIADMHAAGVQDPDIRPKATEEIDTMIKLVQRLIDKGHAYEVDGDVYFAVRSYSAYGELSNRNVDEMESGHRELRADGQGLEDRKRDPARFRALEDGEARRAELAFSVGRRPSRLAYRMLGHVREVSPSALRHPWRRRGSVLPAPRERARAV